MYFFHRVGARHIDLKFCQENAEEMNQAIGGLFILPSHCATYWRKRFSYIDAVGLTLQRQNPIFGV
jgi:hypothetical protein